MADRSRIMVLGGGFAGLFAARELRRRLKDRAEIELISANNHFVFQPLLPEVAGGAIAAMHAVAPLRTLLPGVFVRMATVDEIDFDRRVATVFQGVQRRPTEVAFDRLVIALGQDTDLSRTPGLSEHALTMRTLDDARRLRAHVIARLEHAEVTRLPEVKREALTFTVIGAGFSGIETVGEIKELIDRALPWYPNVDPAEVRVIVVEFAERALQELPERLGVYAARKLAERGVEMRLGTGVASATGTRLVTTRGEVIGTRTIVATIGSAPSALARSLDLETAAGGRIVVDRTLAVPGRPGVWAVGDCALIPMKEGASARTDFAPPTGQFAVREARQVAANVEADIDGRPPVPFAYSSKGALASLGARRGVAEVMGVQLTGFPAWLLWRAYYLSFLPGIATRAQVLTNWVLDGLLPRSVVQLDAARPPAARHVLYAAGDRIYERGTRADGVYTLLEGEVEIAAPDPETGEETRRVIGPGAIFGDRLLVGEHRRGADAHALTDVRALVLERDEVLMIAEGFEPFRRHVAELTGQTVQPPDPR